MGTKQKATRAGVVFIALLLISGLVLMYKGNDALALAIEKKKGYSRLSRLNCRLTRSAAGW